MSVGAMAMDYHKGSAMADPFAKLGGGYVVSGAQLSIATP